MCLIDFFRKQHSWDHLLRLLSQLGTDSRWGKAQYNDPEIAEQLARASLDSKESGKQWRPRDIDWSLINEQLALLIDLQQTTVKVMTASKAKVQEFPRPETEFNKALERLQREQADYDLQRVLDWVEEGQRRWREGARPTLVPPYEEPE